MEPHNDDRLSLRQPVARPFDLRCLVSVFGYQRAVHCTSVLDHVCFFEAQIGLLQGAAKLTKPVKREKTHQIRTEFVSEASDLFGVRGASQTRSFVLERRQPDTGQNRHVFEADLMNAQRGGSQIATHMGVADGRVADQFKVMGDVERRVIQVTVQRGHKRAIVRVFRRDSCSDADHGGDVRQMEFRMHLLVAVEVFLLPDGRYVGPRIFEDLANRRQELFRIALEDFLSTSGRAAV